MVAEFGIDPQANAPHLRGWFFIWTYVCYGKRDYDACRLF